MLPLAFFNPAFFPIGEMASGGILFSGLSEKSMQKRDAGIRNSAYAQKKRVVPFCVLSLHGPSSKRPSGGRGNFCISKSKCGKYLTYRSRNRRRVFRLLRQFNKYASVTRFASLNLSLHEPNSGKNPRKGAAAPFLGRFEGVCKGARLPRESSEAIRVGKGGTTERTTPVRRKRRTG